MSLSAVCKKYLNEVFSSNWIGHGSATLPAPLDLSPYLTIYDNSLWDFIKEKVASQRYANTDKLKQAPTDALQSYTSNA